MLLNYRRFQWSTIRCYYPSSAIPRLAAEPRRCDLARAIARYINQGRPQRTRFFAGVSNADRKNAQKQMSQLISMTALVLGVNGGGGGGGGYVQGVYGETLHGDERLWTNFI